LNIRSLSLTEREKYLAEWKAVQAKFIDQPGPATVEADHLIMEVMQLRNYPYPISSSGRPTSRSIILNW